MHSTVMHRFMVQAFQDPPLTAESAKYIEPEVSVEGCAAGNSLKFFLWYIENDEFIFKKS